jgi:hypothetical protein
MTKTKPNQQGKKTREQQRRTLEGRPGLPREDSEGNIVADTDEDDCRAPVPDGSKRQSEFPIS